MTLLVNGSTASMRRLLPHHPGRLGVLLSPASGNRLGWWPAGTPWAADNGCFGGLDAPAYLRMLAKLAAHPDQPRWVTAPDVVGDAAATHRLYQVWGPLIRELGLPVAYVAQDGIDTHPGRQAEFQRLLNAGELACLFVGGSTGFKEHPDRRRLAAWAKEHGLSVHVGRVNSRRRLRLVAAWGEGLVDSFDGGSSNFGDANIPKLLRWAAGAQRWAGRGQLSFG